MMPSFGWVRLPVPLTVTTWADTASTRLISTSFPYLDRVVAKHSSNGKSTTTPERPRFHDDQLGMSRG